MMVAMQGSRSSEYLTSLSSVRTSPKWSFKGKPTSARLLDTPGPGTYSDISQDTSKLNANRICGFGTSPRDIHRPLSAPGPGQYSPADPNLVSSKYGFGTSQRQAAKPLRAVNPGPGAYTHKEAMGMEGPRYSAAPRREGSRAAAVPGPGAYKSDEVAITSIQMPKYGFSKSPRDVRTHYSTPGPGAYTSTETLNGPKFTMNSRREGPRGNEFPGPGTYCGAHTTFGY